MPDALPDPYRGREHRVADGWHSQTWRLKQTNLCEIDILDIDAEKVVAGMRSFSANVLMIKAARIIASYPTAPPFHFHNPYVEGTASRGSSPPAAPRKSASSAAITVPRLGLFDAVVTG